MTHVLEMNAKLETLKAVEADVEGLMWPISERDEGMALQEKIGHNEALEAIKKLLADRRKKVI